MRTIRSRLHPTLVGALAMMLSACATTDNRISKDFGPPTPPGPSPHQATTTTPLPSETRALSVDRPQVEEAHEVPDLWARIVAGLRFARCDGHPAVLAEAHRYVGTGRFTETLATMLPKLAFVLDEIERRGLPTEFALLPIVESHYRLVPGRGNQPAGPWQLVPSTARKHGVRIEAKYDGRLDLAASTRAALEHLEYLADRFGNDWSAVVKAYNAGEHRVRRALDRGGTGQIDRSLTRTTMTHSARLQALACIIAEPKRFKVRLPSFDREEALAAFVVPAELDLDLAAAASGISRCALEAAHPGIRGERAPKGSHLVLPTSAIERLERVLAAIPSERWADWQTRATLGQDWQSLASAADLAAEVLATANGSRIEADPPHVIVAPSMGSTTRRAAVARSVYVVRAGDSAWTIARRLQVSLTDLLSKNGLDHRSVLRPGQRLRVP